MSFHTHITIADRGWILEKLANEIAVRSNLVSVSTVPDPSADLQYYINYSCRRRRVGPVEIAFFTHSERDEAARKRYFDIAADVEHSVCMSKRYADELGEAGIKDVTTITPGVDLETFEPKVRIGVIGRTYHTGRKGESLVADVMDVPGIDWRFTGQGWPGKSVFVDNDKMPDFYNDLDYVLIPALYEGGPMSVLEGLACGVPIIASDVGWVDEYPHIPFENGNSQSLRAVLTRLVDERLKLRGSVEHRTWAAWGDAHLEMFDKVARKHGIISGKAKGAGKAAATKAEPKLSALLITHGGEGKTLGGPSVRVPRTAEELARIGVAASLSSETLGTASPSDVAHVFNCWPPESAFKRLSDARNAGKATVFSPIFLNLTHYSKYNLSLPRLIKENIASPRLLQAGLAALKAEIIESDSRPPVEPMPGYANKLDACLEASDHVIFLSEHGKRCVSELVGFDGPSSIVRNPVDASRFADADPDLFRKAYNLDQYILCVGRIEARKNQLMLAYVARDLDVPVVFVGHDGNRAYADLVRSIAPGNAIFVPRIDPNDPLLASAFTGASAFCLPSWAEGAPLAALEACAAGVPMVLSDRSSEQEYFGDLAQYVNPADADGLRAALTTAVAQKGDSDLRQKRIDLAKSDYNWDKHARETADVYRKTLAQVGETAASSPANALPAPSDTKIYVDLTTSWHHSGHPTGIARVEDQCLKSLVKIYGARIVPIVWNSDTHNFLKLNISDALAPSDMDALTRLEERGDAKLLTGKTKPEPGRILVFGGAWIRNPRYVHHLKRLKSDSQLNITLLVHDLIQLVARHLYPSHVTEDFIENVAHMVSCADSFLAYSDTTIKDLSAYLESHGEHFKPIQKFRLGDMTSDDTAGDDILKRSELCKSYDGKDFVIYVSSLDLRKNHILLVNVWRRLIEQRGGKVPTILFVGRSMWGGEQIMEMVTEEAALAGKVRFLQDVSDEELHWMYRNCLFTVYPSLHEGWGLPVAESLAMGKVCIASNSTSTREIAPSLTELLDPYDFNAWVEKVGYFLDNRQALKARESEIESQFTFFDWDDTVTEIVSAVDTVPLRTSQRSIVWPGSVIDFADTAVDLGLADDVCRTNWARREPKGRWSVGRTADLSFSTRVRSIETLHLRLELYALADPETGFREVAFTVNDTPVGTFMVNRKPTYVDLELDTASLPDAGFGFKQVDLNLQMPEEMSVSMFSDSSDSRMLGVHLRTIAVGGDTKALDQALPTKDLMKARRQVDYEARRTKTSGAGHVSASLAPAQTAALHQALLLLETPTRLPPTNPVFKALHFIRADTIALKVYRKLTGRTNDALRRTIAALVNDGK